RQPDWHPGMVCEGMVSFIDVTPTVLAWTGAKLPNSSDPLPGRPLLNIKEQNPIGWDQVFASHTFHEIWMYYPMRMVRPRTHKLIWNLAYQLEYPTAGDIARSPSEAAVRRTKQVGNRTLDAYLHRTEFELYDLEKDPDELHNLANDPANAKRKE